MSSAPIASMMRSATCPSWILVSISSQTPSQLVSRFMVRVVSDGVYRTRAMAEPGPWIRSRKPRSAKYTSRCTTDGLSSIWRAASSPRSRSRSPVPSLTRLSTSTAFLVLSTASDELADGCCRSEAGPGLLEEGWDDLVFGDGLDDLAADEDLAFAVAGGDTKVSLARLAG